MTDKVIIDGVDVSRCEHYLNKECLCQYNEIDGRIFKLYRCDDFENCYYKQLQRKEQECEELKEKLNDVACCDDGNTFCFLKQEIVEQLNQLEAENRTHKKTLAEIKEITEPFCKACQEFKPEKRDGNCMHCNYGKILQKISEVE